MAGRKSSKADDTAAKKTPEQAEKAKALTMVMSQIERNFGKGAIMRLGEASRMQIETIPTGALTLDLALGVAYPRGESSKSMALRVRVKRRWPYMSWLRCRRWAG